jgi:hypothetical protein
MKTDCCNFSLATAGHSVYMYFIVLNLTSVLSQCHVIYDVNDKLIMSMSNGCI